LSLCALCAVAASGCGGSQAHPEYDVLSPPDERTAIAWIARAFRKEGYDVESGRKIKISSTTTIEADVSAQGEKWSVLWLRADEQQELKGKLPAAPKGVADGALWALTGTGDDADERILVLLEGNYEYDKDPRGEKGVVRSIQEVEARCVRDVTDFLVRAKAGEIE
jgi:intein/homing endonuclease